MNKKSLLVGISAAGVAISMFGMFFAMSVGQPALALLQFAFLVLNGVNLKNNLGR